MIYAAVFAIAFALGVYLAYYLHGQTAIEEAHRAHEERMARLKAQLGTEYIEVNDDYRKW